ncbi:MAG: hypothetical protein H6648_01065 [Caldilineae bacterium]|nr:hypothetical protein [Caldilineae bacterium]
MRNPATVRRQRLLTASLVALLLGIASRTAPGRGDSAALRVAQHESVALAQSEPLARYWYSIAVADPLANFGAVSGVAGSRIGNDSFAVDRANHRLFRFGTRGEILWVRGGFGGGEGQLATPIELDVDAEDRVFVIDAGNQRVQVFGADGEPLGSWGSRGEGEGQFIDPVDIAVSSAGTVYLLDRALGRVQRLRDNGDIIGSWSSAGTTELRRPEGIAVAPDGTIWLADTGNDRILRFSSRGTLLGEWGDFATPVSIAIGANGDVYVLESDFGRLRRFDENMNYLTAWGGGEFKQPVSVAVTEGNIVYVADTGTNRIERYDSGGAFETAWGGQYTIDGEFDQPVGLAMGANDTLYVLDAFHQRGHRYTLAGAWRDSFGAEGEDPGQFRVPGGIDASPDSTIYVADTGNHRLQRLSAAGASPTAFGLRGEAEGQVELPGDVAITPAGIGASPKVFVADTGNHRIERFDRNGAFELAFGSRGPVEGTFRSPGGIAVSPAGDVWVADTDNHRLQAFDLEGRFLRGAGAAGSALGQLASPRGLEVDDARVYVADAGNARVAVFDAASGSAVGTFGEPTAGVAGLSEPRDISFGAGGRIYVADLLAGRVLVYGAGLPGAWHLSYYDNPALADHPARIDEAEALDFNWADGRPGPGVPADGFGLRAEGYLTAAESGVHAVRVRAEGGVRLWVAGRLLIDRWTDASVDAEGSFEATAGAYYAELEFQDPSGPASLSLDWRPNGGSLPTRTPRAATPTAPVPSPSPGGHRVIHLPAILDAVGLR